MALIEASAAGGKWSAKAAWVGEVVPGAGDDVVLGAASGSITIEAEAKCRSLEASAYKKTLTISAAFKIGTTTSNGGLCIKFGAGMTLAGVSTVTLVSTSGTVEKITTAGRVFKGQLVCEGTGGKWQLEDSFASTTEIHVAKGELKTNGQTVEATVFWVETAGSAVLGTSTIKCTRASGELWKFAGTGSLSAAESTIEGTATGGEGKSFVGGGQTYGTVILIGQFT